MRSFQRFEAWRRAHELVLMVYRVTGSWPPTERFAMISQARRAAFSVAANIAEGSAKRGSKAFRRFLDISLGSLSELQYILLLARDLGYLSTLMYQQLEQQRDWVGKPLWALYRSMRLSADA